MPVIQPEIIITPDQPTIRLRTPQDNTDLDKLLPQVLQAQGWGVGTYFNVQFLNHERNQLLADARFVVISEMEHLKTTDNAYTPNTRMVVAFKAEQVTDWRHYNVPHGTSEEKATDVVKQATIKWNPGKKEHEVLVGEEVVFSNVDKKLAEEKAEELNKAA